VSAPNAEDAKRFTRWARAKTASRTLASLHPLNRAIELDPQLASAWHARIRLSPLDEFDQL
jgi:hypothetical protein